ncbi:MAG TPA: hypothetical protein VIY66_06085 [Candidatus Acidoferrales bacterium]
MSNQRSPNCPQISFSEAIEKGRTVYNKEHTHPAAKAVIAADLGYKGISGASLSLIGALRQYGILEGSKDAMRVSDDAVAYYELDEGEDKRQAAGRMAFKPSLFEEMKSQFGESIPSEANLRHWLIKKRFLPKAADDVIRVYKENITLAAGEQSGYSGPEKDTTMNIPVPGTQQQKPTVGVQTYAFALSPDARAELSLRGTITIDDLEMLRDHIELTIKALARKAKEKGGE